MPAACALGINSGKNILFAVPKRLWAFRNCFFTGDYPLSLLTAFAASSPKGTPFGNAVEFAAATKAVPLGKVASPQAMTEGVIFEGTGKAAGFD